MALPWEVPADTTNAQQRASDPRLTAWVSANAGSGKTHVLTQRVIRLLLQGVPPAKILCLTYTKAAAANMSVRVFKTLSAWTTANDETLRKEILDTGHPEAQIDLPFARRLFARTVETPGGLKIQTIHAFCERLLHLFPFEADVGAQFRVIEEDEQAELLSTARLLALSEAGREPDSAIGHALALLSAQTTADSFEELVRGALQHRHRLPHAVSDEDLAAKVTKRLQAALRLRDGEDLKEVERQILEDGIQKSDWADLANVLAKGSANDVKLAEAFRKALSIEDPAGQVEIYLSILFTQDGDPRGTEKRPIVTKAIQTLDPSMLPRLLDEQQRLIDLRDKQRAAITVERSTALALFLARISLSYARLKDARGALDFDDLIQRTSDLVTKSNASWVLYKLDAGIDHILVDEAQDTSQPQWKILRALADEFFAGEGRRPQGRTFFAVGDEKQSIYSFQGADPRLFHEAQKEVRKQIPDPDSHFAFVELKTSFRSAEGVLKAVDQVFESPEHHRGLSSDPVKPVHEAIRKNVPSLVELWDVVEPEAEQDVRDWRLPLDMQNKEDPPVKVATRIARMIAGWLRPGSRERVQDSRTFQPRPINAGDILILVRRRGPFFEAVIRALKDELVPVAGADRLQLTQHIAIMDLMAAGRAALLPQDDFTTACVLKSPLIGLDDNDLLALAPHRKGSLFDALGRSDNPEHQAAREKLSLWQRDARQLSPFRFFARLLGAGGGRNRLLARLGPEAGDAVDEFLKLALQHDRSEAPSLHGFLTVLEGADVSVKRDMEAAGEAVRVMTVHASKGLEAKIVMLPDTCGAPSGQHDPKLFALEAGSGPAICWSPCAKEDCAAVAQAREARREAAADEYRRLLYVALTRAQERLYVMGFAGKQKRSDQCWYDMVERSLGPLMEEVPAVREGDPRIRRLRHLDYPESGKAQVVAPAPAAAEVLPGWLTAPAPREAITRAVLRPSRLEEASETGFGATARERGILVHALLQHLGSLPATRRASAGAAFLQQQQVPFSADDQAAMLAEVEAVLGHPGLAPLFGPGSRAEVAIAGQAGGGTGPEISGQIDRVAITQDAVWIADFKTGAVPTSAPPAAYVAQLALYAQAIGGLCPGRELRTFLVYTQGPRLIEASEEERREALARLT